MANPSPTTYQARMAKKRRSKPGDLQAVAAKLWAALETAEALLSHEDDLMKLKAVHAVGQVAGNYARVYEIGELEARLQALEAAQAAMGTKVPGAA